MKVWLEMYYSWEILLFGEFLKGIEKKFAHFRLAILPIGSYEKRWFMKNEHMNPDDAVRVHKMLKVTQSVGIHFGTFVEHSEHLALIFKPLAEAILSASITICPLRLGTDTSSPVSLAMIVQGPWPRRSQLETELVKSAQLSSRLKGPSM